MEQELSIEGRLKLVCKCTIWLPTKYQKSRVEQYTHFFSRHQNSQKWVDFYTNNGMEWEVSIEERLKLVWKKWYAGVLYGYPWNI